MLYTIYYASRHAMQLTVDIYTADTLLPLSQFEKKKYVKSFYNKKK